MPEKKIVVGFWLRLVTDSLDALFLAVFGYLIIVVPFRKLIYDLGDSGILIGLGVAFLYFGLLQSALGNGQSLAKKILKIQVLRMDGRYMRLPVSFLRYAIIALLFYGGAIWGALVSGDPHWQHSLAFLRFWLPFFICLGLGTVILVAFHPLKRGLHDLIAGTVVVRLGKYNKDTIEALANPQRAKRAYLAAAIVGVVVFSGSWILAAKMEPAPSYISQEESRVLKAIATRIEQVTVFDNVAVTPMHAISTFRRDVTQWEAQVTLLAVNGKIFLAGEEQEKDFVFGSNLQKAVNLIVQESMYLASYDCINFLIDEGFNIGIVSSHWFHSIELTPTGHPVQITPNLVRIPPGVVGPQRSPGCHVERQAMGDVGMLESEVSSPSYSYSYSRIQPMVPRPSDER